MVLSLDQRSPKIFFGWYIVVASLIITLYTSGVVFFGFTAILEPIVEEFGWSYAQVSIAVSLRGLEVAILAPLMGFLVDRWGPRWLILGGGLFVCAGFIALSYVSSLPMFYGAFILVAIGAGAFTQTVLITAVTNWFHKKVGLATGIAVSGFGLGGLMVPLVTVLIDALQWRMAMLVVGLGVIVVTWPLSLLIRHHPEQYGYQPDGTIKDKENEEKLIQKENQAIETGAMSSIRNRAFFNLSIASMCQVFAVSAVVTHIMPYFSSLGISRSFSSLIALVLPLMSIGGRLGGGWLADRFGNKPIFIASFILSTLGLLFLAYVNTGKAWLMVSFLIALGFGWGSGVTVRLSLIREYFGTHRFGTILGFVSGVMMIGNMAGAPVAGWVFDTWGSYQGAWLGFCCVTIAALFMIFTMPPPGSMKH